MDKRTDIAVELGTNTAAFSAGLNRAQSQLGGFAGRVEGMSKRMRTALKSVTSGNLFTRVKQWGTSLAALGGMYGLGHAIQQVRDFEDALADLVIFGRKNPTWGDQARKQILSISSATGVAKEELATFANRFVELTGNADMAMNTLSDMAKVAVATRSDMGSLAQVMEQLSGGFGLTSAKQITEGMGILAFQALKGSMSFRDIAMSLPEVVGAAGALGPRATGIAGMRDVGALFQLGVRTAGSPEQTKTAVRRYLQELTQKKEKLEGLTGESFTTMGPGGVQQFKSIQDITKILAKAWASGDIEARTKLESAMEGRARKVLQAVGQAYAAGWTKPMGGREAASVIFGAKGAGAKDIQAMFEQRMKTPGQQLRKTMAGLSATIHNELLPAFKKLADIAPTLGKGLAWMVRHATDLVAAWAAVKGVKFFYNLQQITTAMGKGGGLGGLIGGATGVMNVTASTVNVMGGAGGFPGMPGGGGAGGGGAAAAGRGAGAAGVAGAVLTAASQFALLYSIAAIGSDVYDMIKGTYRAETSATSFLAYAPEEVKRGHQEREDILSPTMKAMFEELHIKASETPEEKKARLGRFEYLDMNEMRQAFHMLANNVAQAAEKVAASQANIGTSTVVTRTKARTVTQGAGK